MGNTRRKKKKLGAVVVAVLICAMMILPCIPAVQAVSPDIRIDETKTLLEDSDTDGEGYLIVEAATPQGFEGILRVELLRKNAYKKVTIDISPDDFYMGGQYLEPGAYTVKKAFAMNDKTAIVEADQESITVAADADAHLHLTVSTDPAAEEAWLAMMETYTMPQLPTEATVEANTEATTVETVELEETEVTIHPHLEELEDPSPSIWKTVWSLLKSLALTAIFGGTVYLMVEKFRK